MTGVPVRQGFFMLVCFIAGMFVTWVGITENYRQLTVKMLEKQIDVGLLKHQLQQLKGQQQQQQKGQQQQQVFTSPTTTISTTTTGGQAQVADDSNSLVRQLSEEVKVICIIATHAANHRKKCDHVIATWGKRCNKVVFMSNAPDDKLPILHYNVSSGKHTLSLRHFYAFRDIYKQYYNDYDWFFKADDDTYAIMENMRYFLSEQNSSDPVYFGHVFKTNGVYTSGGAGYVMSKEAMRRFGEMNEKKCELYESAADDVVWGHCMENLGVRLGDSRDRLGRSRFHCFNAGTFIHGGYPQWYLNYDKYGALKGLGWISDYAITFHYISPEQFYEFEYFIYHLRPYGVHTRVKALNGPAPPPPTTIIPTTIPVTGIPPSTPKPQ